MAQPTKLGPRPPRRLDL